MRLPFRGSQFCECKGEEQTHLWCRVSIASSVPNPPPHVSSKRPAQMKRSTVPPPAKKRSRKLAGMLLCYSNQIASADVTIIICQLYIGRDSSLSGALDERSKGRAFDPRLERPDFFFLQR